MSGLIHPVGVVVLAHNEQDLIAACLTSIRLARAHLGRTEPDPPLVRVVTVLDCTGGIREVLDFSEVEQVRVAARRVGTARARGADRVLRTAGAAPGRIWLANTDADSRVPQNWLTAMVLEAERGTHLILGTAVPQAIDTAGIARKGTPSTAATAMSRRQSRRARRRLRVTRRIP